MGFFKGKPKDTEENRPIPEEEDALLEKVAIMVVRWRMAVPAILTLETVKPLNYIGSQAMVFFEPIVQSIFNLKDYDTLRVAMERRENVENLLLKIEKYDAIMFEHEKAVKKFIKGERKKWKWHQRYLGVKRPKIILPEELRKSPLPEVKKSGGFLGK